MENVPDRQETPNSWDDLGWDAFKKDAIFQVTECLRGNGDLRDLINDLDLHYDEYDSLEDSQINSIIIEAVKAL